MMTGGECVDADVVCGLHLVESQSGLSALGERGLGLAFPGRLDYEDSSN